MLSLEECYQLLQLNAGASKDEIKRAFRSRAKQLHPDQNTSPDAHNQFILLHEAYDILYHKKNSAYPSYEKEQARRQHVRRAAGSYAKMKYEEYLREVEMYHNSPYAWVFKMLYYGLFFIYLFCAMLFAFIPFGLLSYGVQWFLLSCPLWVLSYFTFLYAYEWKREIDPLFE